MLLTLPAVLAVLALLATAGGARSCEDHPRRPTISPSEWDPRTTRRNPEYRLLFKGNPILAGTYRSDITVLCSSSNASMLTIRGARNPGDLQTVPAKRLNSTTIQVLLNKPDEGSYPYQCTDSVTNCTDDLYIHVHPAMTVTAPEIHHTLNEYGMTLYFVSHCDTYNVFCSAQQTDLSIAWGDHELETNAFNATTVIATVADHAGGERVYSCGSWDSPLAEISVMVNNYPEAREFQCLLYRKVECWWKSSAKGNTFKLFVLLMHDEESRLICIDRSGALTAGCADVLDQESSSLLNYYDHISFQLETCNTVFCSNQTFTINIRSCTKVEPVYDLKLTHVNPLSATVAWHQSILNFYSTYKVEYRMLGTDWRTVNASTIQCEYIDVCGIEVALPCPDTHYELRLYLRYKQATDTYWSEPASVYFFSAPSTDVDPACDADFREVTEKPPLTADVAIYKVRELISDERKHTKALKTKIAALKEKLAKVKALMDERISN